MTVVRRKLIEVALPLEAINEASAREKSIRHGHPSTLHLWWARRPLAAARAVIFAQMVDDPSSCPDLFPTWKKQQKERERLFRIIEDLVKWENTRNETVLQAAREEIWQGWRRACADNVDHPRARELFDRNKLPAFHDPFAGGGALPLEAQRLGLEAYASDLNPVAVLINKAMIEIPPRFAGRPPVNPESRADKNPFAREWKGAQGLAEDVRYYGKWMRDEAEKRIGHLYPKVEVTAAMAKVRPDLKPYVGQKLTVIAWLWARTVKSPNPAFADVDVPLASTFMLSTKAGKEAYVEPIINGRVYEFAARVGKAKRVDELKLGTKSKGANFRCLLSDTAIEAEYIRKEAQAGRLGERLLAVVAEVRGGRVYLSPQPEMESLARSTSPSWKPGLQVPTKCHDVDRLPMYGMPTWGDAFRPRQLVALTTFSELVGEVYERVQQDASCAQEGAPHDAKGRADNWPADYAVAIVTYLGLGVGRCANYWSSLTPWGGDFIVQTFGRNAIRMVWDGAEANPFSDATGNWGGAIEWIQKVIETCLGSPWRGSATQLDAQEMACDPPRIVSTDPPYYDNIGYAELSDFFYVWLRPTLRRFYPELLATIAVPKTQELVAAPHRHGGKSAGEAFFLNGMTSAMRRLASNAHPAVPLTIYYAFKQAENTEADGVASTGWETFLEAVLRAGLAITGTWPIRTERDQGLKTGTNVLASSVVLVCRPSGADAPTATRREFAAALKVELPRAIADLQRGNIAPVDLAQAAIGPGMAVYTRYAKVLDAEGKPLTVREALALINQVLDETLAEQEGDFDADTRWALSWFEHSGFAEGEYGVAEQLSKSRNTSVDGLVDAGIAKSGKGKVRLLKPSELDTGWDPDDDKRLTAWEIVHHFVRVQEKDGESGAAELVRKLGGRADVARELAYRLYSICERKKRAGEALSYNALVQGWPEITRLASEGGKSRPAQGGLFQGTEE